MKVNGYYSLKLDEIHIESRVRWCPSTNEFVGTCDLHKNKIESYKFDKYLNLEEIKTCLEKGEIHKCGECLVISLLKVDDPKSTVEPICLITICDKKIDETLKNAFKYVYQYFFISIFIIY